MSIGLKEGQTIKEEDEVQLVRRMMEAADVNDKEVEVEEAGGGNVAETLHMRLESAGGRESLEAVCQAVTSDGSTVTYQCSYQATKADSKEEEDGDGVDVSARKKRHQRPAGRIQGKFALNVP